MVQVVAMAEEGKIRVEKFNGQNYHCWKMKMENCLYQKDLFVPLGENPNQPAAMRDE